MPSKKYIYTLLLLTFFLLVQPSYANNDEAESKSRLQKIDREYNLSDKNRDKIKDRVVDKYGDENKKPSDRRPIDKEHIKDRIDDKNEHRLENKEELRDRLSDRKEEVRKERCEKLTDRYNDKIEHLRSVRQKHVDVYSRFQNKMNEVVSKLKDRGLDTNQLELHLGTLNSMIGEYKILYSEFVDLFVSSKPNNCDDLSSESHKDKFRSVKAKLEEVKIKRKEIRDYYKDVIRKDIKDLREQAKKLRGEGDNNNENE